MRGAVFSFLLPDFSFYLCCGARRVILFVAFRSGYYHQMGERFFPRNALRDGDTETARRFSCIAQEMDIPILREQEATMVEKTVEVGT